MNCWKMVSNNSLNDSNLYIKTLIIRFFNKYVIYRWIFMNSRCSGENIYIIWNNVPKEYLSDHYQWSPYLQY